VLAGKIKKGLIITVIAVTIFVIVIISCASPIGKYVIESYVGPKVLGRHIKTSWVYVNPFTGYVHISGLKIYECNGDSITILAADALNTHYNILKTLTKNYEFTDAELVKPVGWIIQNHKIFNFTDLIIHFSPKHPGDSAKGPKTRHPVHINVLNFKITDGEFHYIGKSVPINYYFKHVNISSTGKWWARDSMHVDFDLASGCGTGTIRGDGYIDFYKLDYGIAAVVKTLDMQIVDQYMRELANYASLRGTIDANIKSTGNFKDRLALHVQGLIEISNFHIGKSPTDDIAAFDKLSFSIHDLTPRTYQYYFDSIALHHPSFVYERYDYLDNLRNMFGIEGEKMKAVRDDDTKFNLIIEIGKYVKVLVKNFLQSSYRLDHFNIYNGDLKYIDYGLREKFCIGADPIYIHADSINKNNHRLAVTIRTGIKPHGSFNADLSISPATYADFDLHYRLLRVPVALFNPYLITYTSFPLDRGIIEFNGATLVRSNMVHSDNHLLVLDTRVAKRIHKDDTKWVPLPLIMSIVRSPGNAIDFSIPIGGRLTDPDFNIPRLIGQVIENILIKPPYTPYIAHTKAVEDVVEKLLSIKWEMRSTELTEEQNKFIRQMSDFLKKNPTASITVSPTYYAAKEKEYILLYEAKKKYFIASQKRKTTLISEKDSVAIDKMSVKDSNFVHYLTAQRGVEMLYSVQEKCEHLLGKALINAKYTQLIKERENVFLSCFKDNGNGPQVKFMPARDMIPFDGFSNYKIEYFGATPEKLLKSYDKLISLNNSNPRRQYAGKRKATAGMLIDEKELKKNPGK
jgi:hypothetical protein